MDLKKILVLVLAVVLLGGGGFVVVKKVGLPMVKKVQPVELTYWGLWEPETVMQQVINDYQKLHANVTIKYTKQYHVQYRERLQSALARDDGPDIFRFHNTWLPMLKNYLAAMPSKVMAGGNFQQAFYAVAVSDLRSGADFYAIPLEIDTLALFYNEELLSQAGVEVPKTWSDLRIAGAKLTVRDEFGRIKTGGAGLGTAGNVDHFSDIIGLMMLQNNVNLEKMKESGTLAEDVLTYYTQFKTVDEVWDETLPGSTLAFSQGKLAFYFGFSWDVFEIQNINASLKFKITEVPQVGEGEEVNWASYWVEGVNKKSKNEEAAWEFLKYLSSAEVMRKLYNEEAKTRAFGEIYSRKEMAGELANDPLVSPFVSQAEKAKSWYLTSATGDGETGINSRMISYLEDAINGMVKERKTAAEVLETLAAGFEQVRGDYNK